MALLWFQIAQVLYIWYTLVRIGAGEHEQHSASGDICHKSSTVTSQAWS